MAFHEINGYTLVESPNSESDEQFLSTVESLLREAGIVRERKDWIRFSAGDRFIWKGVQFRELICIAGSAMAMLALRAGREGGLSRAIILRGEQRGRKLCWEIRGGIESEFDPNELYTA